MIGNKQRKTIETALKTLPASCIFSIEHEPVKNGRWQVYVAHYIRFTDDIVKSWVLSICKDERNATKKRDEVESYIDGLWENWVEEW